MFLFARWMATCYADVHTHYDSLSVLNEEDGYWYKDKLRHFKEVVYPNYEKNGTVRDTEILLKWK